ncbi:MAG TPA: GntR family transcriptional regulator [Pyrinomonadaceae bacterium]|jgi:DNA-binding GntR family transcriptional regulator
MTRQITDQLAGLINTGVLAAGEMLPSERTLADTLGVARNVVRRSYDYLMSGELIEGQGRRGRRVRASGSGRSAASGSSGRKRSAAGKETKKGASGKGGKKAGKSSAKSKTRKSR